LKKDKNFLSDKNNGLLSELRTCKDEILNLENKIMDLKSAKKKLKSELSQVSDLNKNRSVDEMLHNELDKIRTKSDDELKNQKKQLIEIHANEIKILRDQVDHLKDQNDKIEMKLKSKERQYDELMSD
jgi:chromosome segregation ATPase